MDDGGSSVYSKDGQRGPTAQALLNPRRPANADSDDESHGQDSYRKLTKFVNNQAYEQPDDQDDEGGSNYNKGSKVYSNTANRKNSDDSN